MHTLYEYLTEDEEVTPERPRAKAQPLASSTIPAAVVTTTTLPRHRSNLTPPAKGTPSRNKGLTFPVEILTRDEVFRLIDACPKHGATGDRNRAMLATTYGCGCRVSELCGLHCKDIDLERGSVTILHGKGNKARVVGIHPDAIPYIETWLSTRTKLGIARTAPLFCCTATDVRGNPVKTAYVRQLMKRLAVKAGIEKRVHPHGLRHTFAVELRREGADLLIIQKSLGHSSAAVTYGYINHLDPGEIIEHQWSRPSWSSSTGGIS